MNKFLVAALSFSVICGNIYAGEIEIDFDKPADWMSHKKVKWVGPKKDIMQVTGTALLVSSKVYDVDPAKKYKIKADVKVLSGGSAITYFGFNPYDKMSRVITPAQVNIRANSETTLLKAVKPGDKKLFLKANPQWARKGIQRVVFGAKKDYSDLPNYDGVRVASIKNVNGNIEVSLKDPVKKAYPAGTMVRAHIGGGYMYAGGYKNIAVGQEVELKGVARGMGKAYIGKNHWAPGTAKARLVILVNWNNNKAVAQIKDVEMEIE